MVKPFISMDVGNITAQIQKVTRALDEVAERVVDGAKRALDQAAEAMLADAQAAAPVQTGRLQESGTAEEIVLEGSELVKRWGFNSKYARIQDQGGTVLPVRARMLAIPLDPVKTAAGASRYSSPLEDTGAGHGMFLMRFAGKLFLARIVGSKAARRVEFRWMLVPSVTLQGNGYVTRTVEAWKDRVPQFVADEVGRAITGGGAP